MPNVFLDRDTSMRAATASAFSTGGNIIGGAMGAGAVAIYTDHPISSLFLTIGGAAAILAGNTIGAAIGAVPKTVAPSTVATEITPLNPNPAPAPPDVVNAV